MLYRYGEGDKLLVHIKFVITTSAICIAYLMLSLSDVVNWIVIVVIVSIVVVILITYSTYQIVGLYYHIMFRKKNNQRIGSEDVKQK